MSEQVRILRKKRDEEEDDVLASKDLRKEQNKLRLMQNELHVEEVIRDRSLKVWLLSIFNYW